MIWLIAAVASVAVLFGSWFAYRAVYINLERRNCAVCQGNGTFKGSVVLFDGDESDLCLYHILRADRIKALEAVDQTWTAAMARQYYAQRAASPRPADHSLDCPCGYCEQWRHRSRLPAEHELTNGVKG